MKITLLGTGTSQGIPVIGCDCPVCTSADPRDNRLRTSAAIASAETTVVIDIGPDFRQQMLGNGISHVDAILLTHEHNDHVIGLDDVRPINFRSKQHMRVFGLPRVLEEVRRRFPYIFTDKEAYPGRPRLELVEIGDQPFQVGDLEVMPVGVWHGNLPILGFRIGRLAYLTDVKSIDEDQLARLRGLDILVINALHRREHWSHLNLEEAVGMVARIAPERAIFTHLSHDMGVHAEVSRLLPPGIALGHDGLVLTTQS